MKPLTLRILVRLFIRPFYRVTVLGPDHVPARGGALLVCNHVSFVDLLLVLASNRRFIRFLLPEEVCELWWLKPFLRRWRVMPLPAESQPRQLVGALHRARDAIRQGEVVGIFAERSVSRIGVMLPFGHGFERIMEGLEAPIIPVCLDGMWGSIFSHQAGRFFWKVPRRLPYPVTVSFGEALPPTATAFDVRRAIQALNTEAWPHRRKTMKPLGRAFIQRARRCPFRFAMGDSVRVPKLSFGSMLMKVVFLARRLRPFWSGQRIVGVVLPASVGGALVNLAALIMGKVPVNLNFKLSAEVLASCARQCDLATIVTSRSFLERMKLDLPCRTLFLEDVIAKPRLSEKLGALALAWLAPVRWIEKALGCEHAPGLDDTATVIFSSGSTGEPKGVMLSHYNLVSNIAQLGQTFDFNTQDRFLGILPFFHSFGFTATLLVPAVYGVGVVYHPNPLDGGAVGDLVHRYRLTYLMATPSFLGIYLRTCRAEDFGSLRLVMAGAEKLPVTLADAFEEKFGIRPVEGYGCTECSPVVAANTHDYRTVGFRQRGSRRGRIGQPLPGISVRIVTPDTLAPPPPGEPGLLLVRGPNVMQGYLGRPDKTAEVLRDGWYNTGDVAALDEDGFLQITGRLSRIIKISGEMVPLDGVEAKLQELAGGDEPAVAVAGVADSVKGERLVVLHTLGDTALRELLQRLPQLDLPKLWIPKASQFFALKELPRLASGKRDQRRIQELAIQFSGAQEEEQQAA